MVPNSKITKNFTKKFTTNVINRQYFHRKTLLGWKNWKDQKTDNGIILIYFYSSYQYLPCGADGLVKMFKVLGTLSPKLFVFTKTDTSYSVTAFKAVTALELLLDSRFRALDPHAEHISLTTILYSSSSSWCRYGSHSIVAVL